MPDRPLLLAYDGSDNAKHAIREAARLFGPRAALVLAVWQDAAAMPSFAWVGGPVPGMQEVLQAAQDAAAKIAADGVDTATDAGLEAAPLVVQTTEPIWAAVVQAAEDQDADAIVMGSRGLSRVKSVLLGSVSSGVVQHARRPTLVVHDRT
jgi:nucleotide-binding universal stress UspA family protein